MSDGSSRCDVSDTVGSVSVVFDVIAGVVLARVEVATGLEEHPSELLTMAAAACVDLLNGEDVELQRPVTARRIRRSFQYPL